MELFARNITNLTDARYFAAYLPTWIAMDLSDDDPSGFQRLAEIQSWVEGVCWAIEPQSGVKDFIEAENHLNIQGLILRDVEQCLEAPMHLKKFLVVHDSNDVEALIERQIISGLILDPNSP